MVSLIQETNNFLPIGAETNFVKKKTSDYMGRQGDLSSPQKNDFVQKSDKLEKSNKVTIWAMLTRSPPQKKDLVEKI